MKRFSSRYLALKIKEDPLLSSLIFLLILLAIVFVVVVFTENPKWISERLGFEEGKKSETLTFLGLGMGGILIALQALMSYKRAKTMEDTVFHTEQGMRQERLKNAIEHLGHETGSVRLGGAYELFHLAKDTEGLRQTVLDILCAHIRWKTDESEYQEVYTSRPSEEIQSLLKLLFVQEYKVFKGLQITLQESYLQGADFEEAHLQGADFEEAHLQEATFGGAHLQGAKFVYAHLQGADFEEAHLQGAKFVYAHLQGADFEEAHLQGADFEEAHLQGADFEEAHLQGADFEEAHLQGTNLHRAHLQEANLHRARLQGANLSEAYLQGADLHRARLQGVNLRRAYLQEANLHRARLQGANLSEAHLPGVVLREAHLQGADLSEAHLQGADLGEAYLQGVSRGGWLPSQSFGDRIRNQISKETDLSGTIFTGGLSREEQESFIEGLSNKKSNELREKLKPHINKLASNELPKNSGAITGAYTEEEAEQWIAEYKEAMSEVPEDNS